LSAKDAGAESVVILEKGPTFGGTTAQSEGVHWIPLNYVEKENGIEDNRDDAIKYIQEISCGYGKQELIESYIDNGHKFVEWARDTWGFVWERFYDYTNQDYYQTPHFRAHGRTCNVDPVASTKAILGEDFIRPDWPNNQQTFVLIKHLCEKNGIEIMLSTEGKKLFRDSTGRVVGILAVQSDGTELRIGANKGILLGTGGFDYNPDMMNSFMRYPFFASAQVNTNTGDGQRMGIEIGAGLGNMGHFYGLETFLPEGMPEDINVVQHADMALADSYQFRGNLVP